MSDTEDIILALRSKMRGGRGTRSCIEAAALEDARVPIVLIETEIPGVCVIACHPEDEGAVFAAIEPERAVGIRFITVAEYPSVLASHVRYELRRNRLAGRMRLMWRLFYRVADKRVKA